MRLRMKRNLKKRLGRVDSLILSTPVVNKDTRTEVTGEQYIDFEKEFGRKAPLRLDIGCGKGTFACQLAAREPEMDLVAVEMVKNVIVSACEKVVNAELENVRFMSVGAEYLPRFIPENSVELIYLNFSTPYPHSREKNRRLTAPRFLNVYKRLLAPDGQIHMKTDNLHFFEYSIQSLSEAGFIIRNVSLDLHNSDFEGNIVTEYEKKFSDMGQPIYRLEAHIK